MEQMERRTAGWSAKVDMGVRQHQKAPRLYGAEIVGSIYGPTEAAYL